MKKTSNIIWLGLLLVCFGSQNVQAGNFLAPESREPLPHRELFLKLFNVKGMNPEVFDLALKAHGKALAQNVTQSHILAIVDYSRPSTEKRLWLIDLEKRRVLLRDYVAHGRNSKGGESLMADYFSNTPNSYASSLGVYVTSKIYMGKHGMSVRLKGLEKDFNANAERRAIVVHSAPYVSQKIIQKNGRLGCSYGCFALRPQAARKLIKGLKPGTFLFAYYPDEQWLKQSAYLKD